MGVFFQCPNIENAEEWYKGIYEMYNTVKNINEKQKRYFTLVKIMNYC